MAQTIRFMSAAKGVTPAADNAAGTLQPSQGSVPAITPDQPGIVVAQQSSVILAAATDPLLAGDIYAACCLPAGHRLLDATLLAGNVDTGAALTLTLAQLTKDFTDIVADTDLVVASTIGQAGGLVRATNQKAIMGSISTQDRWFGVKIVDAPAGLLAGEFLAATLCYQAE